MSLLVDTLDLAVPQWQQELQAWPLADLLREASETSQAIAEHADVLLFGGKKGEAAGYFNRLARGVAIASFFPGGISIFGRRYEARHPEMTGYETHQPAEEPNR